jgi:mannose-6-phosphate isomerase-like protein (cupin superfamily)
MSPAPGVVVRAADVSADNTVAGVCMRTLVATGPGEVGLVRRLAELAPRASLQGRAGGAGELWFVIEGSGLLEVAGQPALPLKPDRGVRLPPGSTYEVRAGEDAGLRVDLVSLPADARDKASAPGQVTKRLAPHGRDFAECEIEVTGDRQFRVLFGPGRDCDVATQFVGEIPPGKAPDHSHPYDEVVLILGGQGIAHIGGVAQALTEGSCAHLPPGLVHCLENTGPGTLRVLGVFHPADSPAAKLANAD